VCVRAGRLALRVLFEQPETFELVRARLRRLALAGFAVRRVTLADCPLGTNSRAHRLQVHLNDLGACESTAYLIKYDSVHGTWAHGSAAEADGNTIVLSDTSRSGRALRVPYSRAKEPAALAEAYKAAGVALVLECTGVFLTRAALAPYFDACGARKVVVSAPVKDPVAVLNVVVGVNHALYDPAVDHIVTAASCTTNCLAPVVKARARAERMQRAAYAHVVLPMHTAADTPALCRAHAAQVIQEQLGIVHGCITTIHNLTNTQTLMDAPNAKKADLRRARSGLVNLAPTSTGSATAIALIFPELKGKLNGLAVRVPLTNASITDCVFEVKRTTTAEEVNALLAAAAAEGPLKGILGFETAPLVSTDYVNDPRSGIVDAECTQVIDGTMVKVYVWYDNEYGYSCRLVDLAKIVAGSM
jgi:glyceraldehyde 3-phosphate dehydrogenase